VTDIRSGSRNVPTWRTLALQDMRVKYKRTFLGPLWITVHMLAYVLGIGLLYGKLFGLDTRTHLPSVACGMLLWTLISGLITEGSTTFVSASTYIRSAAVPLSSFAFQTVTRQVVTFLHSAAVIVIMLLALRTPATGAAVWQVPLAFALTIVNGFFLVLWLGSATARFRDLQPLTSTTMQLMMFITPIFWSPSQLKGSPLAYVNPFGWFVEAFRGPLLGHEVAGWTWAALLALTAVNVVVGVVVFGRSRGKIAYWV
jgi:ABC-type polysaccharide/polyol phosphate export permease